MNSHLSTNSLFLPFQSAYRSFQSTESTALKIHNDIISSIDNGEVTALILLDLSATFDTVDHSILLSHLKNWFGFEDSCLSWFSSYLNLRKQGGFTERYHLFIFHFIMWWCSTRIRSRPTSFHSLYDSSAQLYLGIL